MTNPQPSFIIDCPYCKVKVAAAETGRAEQADYEDAGELPEVLRVLVGNCPVCKAILVGSTEQIGFEGVTAYEDQWGDVIRVYPLPAKTFYSARIPKVVRDSLSEAERSLQAGANIAACVMLGRALEALCRDVINVATPPDFMKAPKKIMLGAGIKKLKDMQVIDQRLYDWSQQLKAFRDLAAHPEDISISREDARDLQIFVHAIIEYIYDLADRYDEFKVRLEKQAAKKPTTT